MVNLFLYVMTSEIVGILLLLLHKTFCNNSNANEEVAVGFCHVQSLHKSGSISIASAHILRATSKQKFQLVPTQNEAHIASSPVQGKLLWLQIPSICKIAIS